MDKYESVRTKVNKEKKAADAKAAEYEKLLSETKAKRLNAEAKYNKASSGDDWKSFHKARTELSEIDSAIEYYELKLKEVSKTNPHEAKEDQYKKDIQAIQREIESTAEKEAYKLLNDAFIIARDAFRDIMNGNELLSDIMTQPLEFVSPDYYKPDTLRYIRNMIRGFANEEERLK